MAKEKTVQVMEFSKKMIIIIFTVTGVIIAFTLALMWKTGDLTPLAYLIPAMFVEVATATGFYYHKSKRENEIKLMALYGDKYRKIEDEEDIY